MKQEVCLDLLGRENWDLFTCGFSETHCCGHQFWHFHDPRDRNHDPDADPRLQGAIRELYARIDEAVGALVEAAGPDANVLVFTSHGMGLYIGGYQLLPRSSSASGMAPGRAVRSACARGCPDRCGRFFAESFRARLAGVSRRLRARSRFRSSRR